MNPTTIIRGFDQFLFARKTSFEGVAIGAGALHVMGIIRRQTVDIDVLTPDIPEKVLALAEEFRQKMKAKGIEIIPGWINNGPKQILDGLPSDWRSRSQVIFKGKAITLLTLGRVELIATKLMAFCDRQELDEEDLREIKPTKEELLGAMPIVQHYDGNPDWPKYVESKIRLFARSLGYEL